MTPLDLTQPSINTQGLSENFLRICNCGGRLCGTDSEKQAIGLLRDLGEAATGVSARSERLPYRGWRGLNASISIPEGPVVSVHPLVRTVPTGSSPLKAEVLDLGRGAPEDFDAVSERIPGRIVMVRHEHMFAPDTIHRRVKYNRAVTEGAAGFLIVGPVSGSLVSGSTGREPDGVGIPAVGISPEIADMIRQQPSPAIAELSIETREYDAETENLFFDIPGETDEWIVLTAHIDGHDLAESAMDNGTGLATALAAAEALAPELARRPARRGLRLAFHSLEEWALNGSAISLARMDEQERDKIAACINIDSVGFDPALAALTSDFPGLGDFLKTRAAALGIPLRIHEPLQSNSDHANFAKHGIPAFRLVAGFGTGGGPAADLLTSRDTRDRIDMSLLSASATLVASIAHGMLHADCDLKAELSGATVI